MSHSDAHAEADVSFGLDSVEFGQDAARIWSQCCQDLCVTVWKHDKHLWLVIIIIGRVQVNKHNSTLAGVTQISPTKHKP